MKTRDPLDRIERALWQAGRMTEPYLGGPSWQDGVMASLRRIGPLKGAGPARGFLPPAAWAWAAAAAACLVIGIASNAFSGLNSETVVARLFLDDPADVTVNIMFPEL